MERATQSLVIAGLVGLVVGAGGMWLANRGGPEIRFVEGYAYANNTGDSIGLSSEPGGKGEGYTLLPEAADGGDASLPTCMEPLQTTPVRLGVVHIAPQGNISGRDVVVWVDCKGPSEEV